MMNSMELYHMHSPQMASCDLLEWQSRTALGWAIRMVTRKPVNHSSIVLRMNREGLEDRRFLLEALEGGMELRLLSTRLEKYKGLVWWYALKPSLVTKKQRNRMINWAIVQTGHGKGYDYGGLIRNVFGRVSVDAKNWFCSEAYTAMLQRGGMYPKDGKALRPGEFDQLELHIPPVLIFDSTL
jgi:hypothetical protein